MHIVYILKSQRLDRYYVGYTSDFETRISFHLSGESRKYTAKAEDWICVLKISAKSKTQGIAIETHIKQMKSRIYIENLLRNPEMIERLLERFK